MIGLETRQRQLMIESQAARSRPYGKGFGTPYERRLEHMVSVAGHISRTDQSRTRWFGLLRRRSSGDADSKQPQGRSYTSMLGMCGNPLLASLPFGAPRCTLGIRTFCHPTQNLWIQVDSERPPERSSKVICLLLIFLRYILLAWQHLWVFLCYACFKP